MLCSIVLLPTIAGILGILLPALGYLPSAGALAPQLDAVQHMLALSGIWWSAGYSLGAGLVATAVSVLLATAMVAGLSDRATSRWLDRLVAPAIAVPHLTIAVGAAFLLAPSGWLVRFLTLPIGLTAPPAIGLGAGYDLAVFATVLVMKETPFLVAVFAASARQADGRAARMLARSLGHGAFEARLKVEAPLWLARSRLPILAVLVYAIGNAELALVLGPTRPTLLPVVVLDFLSHPDLARRPVGAAAALLLVAATFAGFLLWRLACRATAWLFAAWLECGPTPAFSRLAGRVADLGTVLLLALLAGTAAALALWSLAGAWRFPDLLPERLHLGHWLGRFPSLLGQAGETLLIGVTASLVALAIVLFWLETTGRDRAPAWLWAPLVVPQVAFLFGLQLLLLGVGLEPGTGAVLLAHLVFVMPYTALLLTDGWARQDPRFAMLARSLGHGRWRVFWQVKLPMLRGPVLLALAIGFSVSVALFLPTLVAGGGRVATLALELVGLAQSGDRRLAAATGMVLAALPLGALLAARRFGR